MVFADDSAPPPDAETAAPPAMFPPGDVLPYTEAKRHAQDAFEREYLSALMQKFSGKVAQAAQAAGVDRVYLYRLLRRQGIKPREN
jgi:DNA-binding NtrC family response regulator